MEELFVEYNINSVEKRNRIMTRENTEIIKEFHIFADLGGGISGNKKSFYGSAIFNRNYLQRFFSK